MFLVDTGAEVSVIPPVPGDATKPQTTNLRAANGTAIRVFGQRSLTIDLGLRRPFRWIFTIAAVPFAILGIDFLQHFDLLVDARHRKLVDQKTQLFTCGVRTPCVSVTPIYIQPEADKEFLDLFRQFPQLVRSADATLPVASSVTHHIRTRGPPVSARPRRLAHDKLKAAKAEFEHMLELGIIRHFRPFLEGRSFTVFTDHKPLVYALDSSSTLTQSTEPPVTTPSFTAPPQSQ
ncbi:unnamed protein product, partial [Dicrocoelium dendriticum]